MNQTEPTRQPFSDKTETPTQSETPASVVQVEEGAFMNLTSAIQSIHLKVWVSVESSGTLRMESIPLNDERALVHAGGRLFSMGSAEEALKQIRQAQTGFDRKKSEWERRVRQSEDDSSRRRAMRELHQKRAYHNPINTRISPAENQFRRLIESLDVHVALEKRREMSLRQESSSSASPGSEEPQQVALPVGFWEAFSTAEAGRRAEVVIQFFDVEAELTVEVASTKAKRKAVKFSPPLPRNRLYYFGATAQIIRLRRVKITADVFYHNFETQQNESMPLASVIEYVQAGGMWLLQPKSDDIDRP